MSEHRKFMPRRARRLAGGKDQAHAGGSLAAVFYETARGVRPAWDFLTDEKTPIDVRIELLTTVRAVLQVGPPRFPTSTQRWRLMHKPASKKLRTRQTTLNSGRNGRPRCGRQSRSSSTGACVSLQEK
jgi:hypothetical protein